MLFAVDQHDLSVATAEMSLGIYNELGQFKEAEFVEGFLERIGKRENVTE